MDTLVKCFKNIEARVGVMPSEISEKLASEIQVSVDRAYVKCVTDVSKTRTILEELFLFYIPPFHFQKKPTLPPCLPPFEGPLWNSRYHITVLLTDLFNHP